MSSKQSSLQIFRVSRTKQTIFVGNFVTYALFAQFLLHFIAFYYFLRSLCTHLPIIISDVGILENTWLIRYTRNHKKYSTFCTALV